MKELCCREARGAAAGGEKELRNLPRRDLVPGLLRTPLPGIPRRSASGELGPLGPQRAEPGLLRCLPCSKSSAPILCLSTLGGSSLGAKGAPTPSNTDTLAECSDQTSSAGKWDGSWRGLRGRPWTCPSLPGGRQLQSCYSAVMGGGKWGQRQSPLFFRTGQWSPELGPHIALRGGKEVSLN